MGPQNLKIHYWTSKGVVSFTLFRYRRYTLGHMGILYPVEVEGYRTLTGMVPDCARIQLDSWGLKRLFSHGLRRWNSAGVPKVIAC